MIGTIRSRFGPTRRRASRDVATRHAGSGRRRRGRARGSRARELARRRAELAGLDPRDRRGQLRLQRRHVLAPCNSAVTSVVRALEELVDDLDLARARRGGTRARRRAAAAGSRARRPPPAGVLEDVRLVVDDERLAVGLAWSTSMRPWSRTPSCSKANERSTVAPGSAARRARELRARSTRRRARRCARAPRRSRSGSGRARLRPGPRARRGVREVDPLEQHVHRVADLGRGQAGLAGRRRRASASSRAARRPARRRSGTSSARTARARCTRAGARGAAAARAPRTSGQRAAPPRSRPRRSRPRTARAGTPRPPARRRLRRARARSGRARSSSRAPPRSISTGAPPRRRARGASSRSSTQPIGVDCVRPRSGSIAPETISRSIARVIAT